MDVYELATRFITLYTFNTIFIDYNRKKPTQAL